MIQLYFVYLLIYFFHLKYPYLCILSLVFELINVITKHLSQNKFNDHL